MVSSNSAIFGKNDHFRQQNNHFSEQILASTWFLQTTKLDWSCQLGSQDLQECKYVKFIDNPAQKIQKCPAESSLPDIFA